MLSKKRHKLLNSSLCEPENFLLGKTVLQLIYFESSHSISERSINNYFFGNFHFLPKYFLISLPPKFGDQTSPFLY